MPHPFKSVKMGFASTNNKQKLKVTCKKNVLSHIEERAEV